jgi:hypothetical protein
MPKSALAALFTCLLLTGCASNGESNVRIGIGLGSFGSSGGVAVSGSTDVPVGGHKNPLPFAQIWLPPEVAESVYPDKEMPFTATTERCGTLD